MKRRIDVCDSEVNQSWHQNNRFSVLDLPMLLLKVFGWIPINGNGKSAKRKILLVFTLAVNILGITVVFITYYGMFSNQFFMENTPTIPKYIFISDSFQTLFGIIFLWEFLHNNQIHDFLVELKSKNVFEFTSTRFVVVACVIATGLGFGIQWWMSLPMNTGESVRSIAYHFTSVPLFKIALMMIKVSYQVYVSVLVFLYPLWTMSICLHLAIMLNLTHKMLANKLKSEEIYGNDSPTCMENLLEKFDGLVKVAAEFGSLFSRVNFGYFALCINNCVSWIYFVVFVQHCKLSAFRELYPYLLLGLETYKGLLFVIPPAILHSQVPLFLCTHLLAHARKVLFHSSSFERHPLEDTEIVRFYCPFQEKDFLNLVCTISKRKCSARQLSQVRDYSLAFVPPIRKSLRERNSEESHVCAKTTKQEPCKLFSD